MAIPSSTVSRPPEPDRLISQHVQGTTEELNKHPGGTAIYSLHQCCALTEILSKMRAGTVVEDLPAPPKPCRFLNGGKPLESRTVMASSSWMGSLRNTRTDSRQPAGAIDAEVQAELERMDQRIQKDYQRICSLNNQLGNVLEIALQTETALGKDIPFYEKALQKQYENSGKLTAMGSEFFQAVTAKQRSLENELLQKTRMLESKNKQVEQLGERIQKLSQQSEQSGSKILKPGDRKIETVLRDRTIILQQALDEARQELKKAREERKEGDDALRKIQEGEYETPERVQKLKKDLNSANVRLIDKGYEIDRLHNDAKKLKKDLEEVDRSCTAARKDVRKLEEERYVLSKRADRLEKDLIEANRGYQDTLRIIQEENADLNRGYQDTIRRIQEENAELTKLADNLGNHVSAALHSSDYDRDRNLRARIERLEQSRPTEQLEHALLQKAEMLKATQEQLSEVESQKALMLRKLKNMYQKLTAMGVDLIPKNKLSQLQNDLQRSQSLLQEKVNELSAFVAQSRQWDTDRAAMQREIETLRAELKAVSIGNQTTET
ncbi:MULTISPECIES: hypothetical protein [unclassified Endozoicomonas]|uniref:hypothetical protein n=1 Tax=unclassified Endozoicomonas TaxID=2644528 RepID=UPI0021498330|nr:MULTISPECIES: hypothetical protein [unclassified Endozoicomonas]